jgi:hypothetical protein
MVLESNNRRKEISNLTTYHQNIRSLNKKKDEINIMLQESSIRPHLICLSEHHKRKEDMSDFSFPGYKLANSFCRAINLKGGVCILARNDIIYQAVDLNKLCKEKIFEISAIKLNICNTKMILCCVYRSPSENPNYFLQLLQKKTLKLLYQPTMSFTICGHLNVNFFIESAVKQKLDTITKTFNLTQVVTFPTRISNNKGTLTAYLQIKQHIIYNNNI